MNCSCGSCGSCGSCEFVWLVLDHVRHGDMEPSVAHDILTNMDPNAAMGSLGEFARLLAAVVVVYPERMDAAHDKTTLRAVLINACSPATFHWYFNNVKFRSGLPPHLEKFVASGTTRNEALHARLNAHFHTTTVISKRTLAAEVNTFLAAEMAVFVRALKAQVSRRVARVDRLPFVSSSTTIFTQEDWDAFVGAPQPEWTSAPKEQKRGSVKRKGPSAKQEEVYAAIRAKVNKRPRCSVYDGPARRA